MVGSDWFLKLLNILPDLLQKIPWLEILGEAWKAWRKLARGLADEGMYEVLSYESVLQLQDRHGRHAHVSKSQMVRYRQHNILAYQDHAWGDGDILLNYRCTPGVVVDRYRHGHKDMLLISLREVKRRGDEDEFQIDWDVRDGFLRDHELWETDIRHVTRKLTMRVQFPQSRPPKRVWLEQVLGRKKEPLGDAARRLLADGRVQVTWRTRRPRLNERYQLHWEW